MLRDLFGREGLHSLHKIGELWESYSAKGEMLGEGGLSRPGLSGAILPGCQQALGDIILFFSIRMEAACALRIYLSNGELQLRGVSAHWAQHLRRMRNWAEISKGPEEWLEPQESENQWGTQNRREWILELPISVS